MLQRILQSISALRLHELEAGSKPIGDGLNIAYEAGRRIGVRQGIDKVVLVINDVLKDKDAKDGDL